MTVANAENQWTFTMQLANVRDLIVIALGPCAAYCEAEQRENG